MSSYTTNIPINQLSYIDDKYTPYSSNISELNIHNNEENMSFFPVKVISQPVSSYSPSNDDNSNIDEFKASPMNTLSEKKLRLCISSDDDEDDEFSEPEEEEKTFNAKEGDITLNQEHIQNNNKIYKHSSNDYIQISMDTDIDTITAPYNTMCETNEDYEEVNNMIIDHESTSLHSSYTNVNSNNNSIISINYPKDNENHTNYDKQKTITDSSKNILSSKTLLKPRARCTPSDIKTKLSTFKSQLFPINSLSKNTKSNSVFSPSLFSSSPSIPSSSSNSNTNTNTPPSPTSSTHSSNSSATFHTSDPTKKIFLQRRREELIDRIQNRIQVLAKGLKASYHPRVKNKVTKQQRRRIRDERDKLSKKVCELEKVGFGNDDDLDRNDNIDSNYSKEATIETNLFYSERTIVSSGHTRLMPINHNSK